MQKVVYLLVLMSFILVGCGSDEAVEAITGILDPDAPVLGEIGNKTVTSGDTLTFTVTATDPNNLSFTLATDVTADPYLGNGNNAEFTASTGVFEWNTTNVAAGDYSVEFSVMNSVGLSDSETIRITIQSVQTQIQMGETLYSENCIRCHGFIGQPGTEFPIGAPTPAQMEAEFIPANGGTMSGFSGVFSLDQKQSMYEYLCSRAENQPC